MRISSLAKQIFFITFLFLFTLKTHKSIVGDGDEPHYILIAESIVDDFDFRMDNQYPDRHQFVPQFKTGHITKSNRGFFPLHDVGLGFLMAPMILLAHAIVPHIPDSFLTRAHMGSRIKVTQTMLSIQSMLLSSFLAVLLFFYLIERFHFSEKLAFWSALFAVLTPPILTYGYLLHTEIYSATFTLLAFWALGRYKLSSSVWVYSVSLFVLSWLHAKNMSLAFALVFVWMADQFNSTGIRSWKFWIPLIALSVAILLRLELHHYYFGHYRIFVARTDLLTNPLDLSLMPLSFVGQFFDRQYGLMFASPIFLLSLAAIFKMAQTLPDWWRKEGIVILLYVGGLLPFYWWWSGGSPPARHLLTVVPLFWPGIIKVLNEMWWNVWSRVIEGVLIGGSILISIYVWQFPRYTWWRPYGHNFWMDAFTFHHYSIQRIFPSLLDPRPNEGTIFVLWIAVIGLFNYWLLRNGQSTKKEPNISK